jgi:hypothetical protein
MVAVTLLVMYLLPLMLVITKSKARAIQYTHRREMRDLAQRKLFDRMHYYEERDEGDFSTEGRPNWTWSIAPPEMVGSGEQVLLQYTITVAVPQQLGEQSRGAEGGSTFEMTVWALPDARWYEEQALLYERGYYSPLYGDPSMPLGGY